MTYKHLKFFFNYNDIIPIIISYADKTTHKKMTENINREIRHMKIIKDIRNIGFLIKLGIIFKSNKIIKKINCDLDIFRK